MKKSKKKYKMKKSKKKYSIKNESNTITQRIDNSLYPFWYNKIKFPKKVQNKELIEEKNWQKHLKLAANLFKEKKFLPKGTILFHGSGIINPIENIIKKDTPFFFGLDAFIAIWYITEFARKNISDFERLMASIENDKINQEIQIKNLKNYDKSKWSKSELNEMRKEHENEINEINEIENKFISCIDLLKESKKKLGFNEQKFTDLLSDIKLHNRRYYFLNIYETKKNIPYKYLEDSIQFQNPLDEDKCKKIACMHPQFGYHLHELEPPVELSIEFAIPANQIGNNLKLIGVFVIDVFKLNQNKNKNFNEFKAIESIVLKSYF